MVWSRSTLQGHSTGLCIYIWEDENKERVAGGTRWYKGGATQAGPCNKAMWKQVYLAGRQQLGWRTTTTQSYPIDTLLFKQEESTINLTPTIYCSFKNQTQRKPEGCFYTTCWPVLHAIHFIRSQKRMIQGR